MEYLNEALWALTHLDQFLNNLIVAFGPGIYAILFLIVFCETGLIVLPFLPGDSLLFALGALTATDNAYLRLDLVCVTIITAALLGDNLNYTVGRFVGLKLFTNPKSKIFRREYLDRTHKFYAKHGGRMVILARFAPILRTFSPFVAGMATMKWTRFFSYSVVGALLWVFGFTFAGHYFGNMPAVKRNFHVVILAIIVISVIPVCLEIWKARKEKSHRSS